MLYANSIKHLKHPIKLHLYKSIFSIQKGAFSNNDINKDKDNIINKISKQVEKENYNDKEIKIDDFYKFMEENIQKNPEQFLKNKKLKFESSSDLDDVNELIKLIKCPITEENLEICEEGFKVSVILLKNIFF